MCFYCNIKIVRMSEKLESKTENENGEINVHALHLRLKISLVQVRKLKV